MWCSPHAYTARDGVSIFVRREFFPGILAAISSCLAAAGAAGAPARAAARATRAPAATDGETLAARLAAATAATAAPAEPDLTENDVAALWLREGVLVKAEAADGAEADRSAPSPAANISDTSRR
ncbi:hypothetical protein ACFFJB_02420 [Camelimonas abortus]